MENVSRPCPIFPGREHNHPQWRMDVLEAYRVDKQQSSQEKRRQGSEMDMEPLIHRVVLLQEGRAPSGGPHVGSCLTLRRELSEETIGADKAKDLIGKPPPTPAPATLAGEQQGEGTQENGSATWLAVSGVRAMGLVSRLSLASRLAQTFLGLT